MAKIFLKEFGGMVPRIGEQHLSIRRKLNETGFFGGRPPEPSREIMSWPHATEAENCRLFSGELRPLKQPALFHQFCRPGEPCFNSPLPGDPSIPPPDPPDPPPVCEAVMIDSLTPGLDLGPKTAGDVIVLTVNVNTDATAPIQYQWFKNGIALPSEVGAVLTYTILPEDVNAADFRVFVQNPCGSQLSDAWFINTGYVCKEYACDTMLTYWNQNAVQDLHWPMIGQTVTNGDGVWSQQYVDSGNTNTAKNMVEDTPGFEAFFPNGSFPANGTNPDLCENYGPLNVSSDTVNETLRKVLTPTERTGFESGVFAAGTGAIDILIGGMFSPRWNSGVANAVVMGITVGYEVKVNDPNGFDWTPSENEFGLEGTYESAQPYMRPLVRDDTGGVHGDATGNPIIVASRDEALEALTVRIQAREYLRNGLWQDVEFRVRVDYGAESRDTGWVGLGRNGAAELQGEPEYRLDPSVGLKEIIFRNSQKLAHFGVSNAVTQADVDALYEAYDQSFSTYQDPQCTP